MMTNKEFAISNFFMFLSLMYLQQENICILRKLPIYRSIAESFPYSHNHDYFKGFKISVVCSRTSVFIKRIIIAVRL